MDDDKYSWDLERLLGDGTIQDLTDEYFIKLGEIAKLYDEDIFRSKEKLLHFHNTSLKCSKVGNRLYNYIQNKYQEDLSNFDAYAKLQELKLRAIPYHQKIGSFVDRAIDNREIIQEYLKDPDFEHLTRYYHNIFRTVEHKLPHTINKFMLTYAPLGSSYESIFTILKDKNLPLMPAKDKDRKLVHIHTYEDYVSCQYSEDRMLRKSSYYSWNNAIEKLEDSLAQIMYFKFLEQNIDAKNCNFHDGFCEAKMFEDELPEYFVPHLYRKVASLSSEYRKFKKTRKKKLMEVHGIKGIKPWDLRMPVVKDSFFGRIEIEEAKTMALEALEIFGKDYVANVKRAFDERWIDWEKKKNKTSGAYCISSCYGLDSKYILMNYGYKLDDVYTLVHELGHAMHALEFSEHQAEYADTSIFIAEIPSSLNEIVLSFHLIQKYKDDEKKQFEIYDYLINNFFSATISQIILSDWEYDVNRLIGAGRVLTAESAKMVYKAKQQKYQGNRITKPLSSWKDLALTNILTIPHFYSGDFYVYKYAVGKIVGLMIYMKLKDDPSYINKFFDFLRSGSSKSNLETLKILDIDLGKTRVWAKLKKELIKWVNTYVSLGKRV